MAERAPLLSVERLFSDPPLFGGMPSSARFTPDGAFVAYLRVAADDRERQDLWRYRIGTGEHMLWVNGADLADPGGRLTDAEKAERERRRQFNRGVTRFAFDDAGSRMLLPVDGALYLMALTDGTLSRVTAPGTRQTDARFVPDGSAVSYVRDANLYRYDIASARETALTDDGGGTVSNGIADFIAQEEMHRFEGYWWSPDGRYLAYTRVDEAPVAESYRYEIDADAIRVVPQRYPYAGAPNAEVRLLVLDLTSGARVDIAYAEAPDDYLARVGWLGGRLAVQRQSRDQRSLTLRLFEPSGGPGRHLLTETSSTWVNLHDNFHALDDERFLWTSERSGSSHLLLCDAHGGQRPLSAGAGRVERVLGVHAQHALVLGWDECPTEQHLFRVALTGERPERALQRLTTRPGWHEVTLERGGARALDRVTALDHPGSLALLELSPQTQTVRQPEPIAEERITDDHPYFPYFERHLTPTLGTLTAEDGQTLHFRLTRPAEPLPAAGAPVILYVYGGPGVQRVRNEWPPLLLQLLAQSGYGVLELDNRGTGNRGPAFEAPIHGRLGHAEVRDQLVGAAYLRGLDWVDGNRLGVFGHSYGGYMTLMCLLQAGEVFKAGVAVAPVTDWALYDTHYTERYLGTPAANPEGYRASAVFAHVEGLKGRLLLIHGMADDNVLYTHSTKLYRALQARHLPFEMMAYPGAKHAIQERDLSIHRFELLLDFFGRSL